MYLFKTVCSQILGEANLFDVGPIKNTLSKLLGDKEVSDSRIVDWLNKAEKKFLQNNNNDEINIRGGIISKHVTQSNDPSWAADSYDITYSSQRIGFLGHVVDFLKSRDEDYLNKLYKKTPEEIYSREVPAWDIELKNPKKAAKNDLIEGTDYKILKQWTDGMKIIATLSPKAGKYEGDTMGHCAGDYDPKKLRSLWDSQNEPHVTLEFSGTKNIQQIKGKGNAPPINKYKPYIIEYIKENNFEVEGDGRNIGMVAWEGIYYFRDSTQFKKIYSSAIIPKQQKAIQQILKTIVTVDENFQYVLAYRNLI